jgi:hypothetical protein
MALQELRKYQSIYTRMPLVEAHATCSGIKNLKTRIDEGPYLATSGELVQAGGTY